MNNQIIPQGPAEVVTGATITNKRVMYLEAITDIVVSAITFRYPATPAEAGLDTTFTLPAGGHLFHIKAITFTGTAFLVYSPQPTIGV